MTRVAHFFAALLLVGCSTVKSTLSVADVSRPSRGMLNASVEVRGYIFFHSEEVLLCPENSYASAPFVELNLGALYTTPSGFEHREAQQAEFMRLIARFDGKVVIVHGTLRVGPIGKMQRPMVYIEVSAIEEANKAPEATPGRHAPLAPSPSSGAPQL